MGRVIAFIILFPFRLIFWGGLALLFVCYLYQWGIVEDVSLWEMRRQQLYEACLYREEIDPYWEGKEKKEMVRYCKRRTIQSPIDIAY